MRLRAFLLAVAMILVPVVPATAHPASEAKAKCHSHYKRGPSQLERLARCTTRRMGFSRGARTRFVSLMRCESRSRWNAISKSRRYWGPAQQDRDRWTARVWTHLSRRYARRVLRKSHDGILSAPAHIRVSGWMILRDGWGHWPRCA